MGKYNRKPFITAHAGCENTQANSLEYLNLAIENGADIVEIDVNVTLDKIPVLIHDDCVFYNSEILKISEINYERLKEIKKEILRLDEALRIIKSSGKIANVDIKDKDIENLYLIADTIRKADAIEDVFVTGCNANMACQIKKALPSVQVLLNAEMEYSESSVQLKNKEVFADICNRAISNGCCGININYKNCSEEFVSYTRRRGLLLFVWTVDEIEMMKNFIRQGVDSITTNKVKVLKELLGIYDEIER